MYFLQDDKKFIYYKIHTEKGMSGAALTTNVYWNEYYNMPCFGVYGVHI